VKVANSSAEVKIMKAVVVLAVAAAALTGCSSAPSNVHTATGTSAPKQISDVRIGVVSATAPPAMLAVIAQSLGIAKTHGLNLTFVNIAPAASAQALASNQFDVLAAPSIEQSIIQGAKFKVIAGAAAPYFSLWGKKGDVSSWSQLKGKTVGIPAGQDSTAAVLFNALLLAHKVSPTSVTLKYNSAVTNYQAMSAGAVDAGLTTPPYTYELSQAGTWGQIDSLSKDQKGYLSTEFTASQTFVNGNKPQVAEFVAMLQDVEKQVAATPISTKVTDALASSLQSSGIDPKQFNVKRFLTDMSTNGTWQIIPTKKLIAGDLHLLSQIPSLTTAAQKSSFSTIVYTVPKLAKLYDK
jgi:ABC-type nitrate/sulfonate/bicarbonate transport system substrate-binding protein